MKTFSDLKIGDPIFIISNDSVETIRVTSLCGKYTVGCSGGYGNSTKDNVTWDEVKDETKFKAYYRMIYCNMSEALMDLKQSYKDRMDAQWEEVQKATEEFIKLKNEVYKYL